MKGEVLNYDDNTGLGQISGADGIRYSFMRSDLKQLRPVSAGTRVDFDFDGKEAKDIYVEPSSRPGVAGVTPYSGSVEPDRGLWGYFTRALTSYYANFYGRARRKEFWGFILFTWLFYLVLSIVIAVIAGSMAGGAAAAPSSSSNAMMGYFAGIGVVGIAIYGIAWLVLIIPTVAVTVRRFHDVGQSGWIVLLLYVLGFVLSFILIGFIAFIILIVICCLDGQPGENKFGPPVK